MASLGDLVVNLRANKTDFDKGMQVATRHMAAFAAAAGAAVAGAVYKFAAFGDELQKNSLRTGIAVESLSALNYAAGQSGASVEAVAKSFAGLARFTNDLRRGSATAADAMRLMGLELDDLAGLSPEQSYRVLADAIAGIEDPLLQGAAAQQIFGRSGRELLPMLKGGSAEIDRLTAKAEQLGVVLDQQAADSAAAVTDAMDDLSTAVTAATVKFGAMFAPAVTAALTTLAQFIGENQAYIKAIGAAAVQTAVFAAALTTVSAALALYARRQAIAQALSGPKGWAILAGAAVFATAGLAALNSELAKQERNLNSVAAAQDKAAAAGQDNTVVARQTITFYREQEQIAEDMSAAFEAGLITPAQKLQAEIADVERKYMKAANAGGQFRVSLEQLRQQKLDQFLDATGYSAFFDTLSDELRVLRGETTRTAVQLEELAAKGIPAAQIDTLRAMQAERQKIIAQQEEERKKQEALTALREQKQARAEAILEKLKSPAEMVAEQIAEINTLVKDGFLTLAQGAEAIAQVKAGDEGEAKQPRQQTAGAMQRGSAEAFSAIVQAMGQKDPQVAHIDKMRKAVVAELQKLNKKKPVEIEEAGAV